MPIMTGLSGNEMFCLNLKGYSPGELVIGNSVFSMGFAGALGAIGRGLMGGEVTEITNIIHEGRIEAFDRMAREAQAHGGVGITGVTNELRTFHGHSEFLSVASTVHRGPASRGEVIEFSTSADGQELYCQLDAGFSPVKFVFGNVAYSVGVAGRAGRSRSSATSSTAPATWRWTASSPRPGGRAPTRWSASRRARCRSPASTRCS
jgi:uncharacterized protein YbjQ (UPF0145 family)